MKRRKITLADLASFNDIKILSEEDKKTYMGGGNGSIASPYTWEEYMRMGNSFRHGFVEDPENYNIANYLSTPYWGEHEEKDFSFWGTNDANSFFYSNGTSGNSENDSERQRITAKIGDGIHMDSSITKNPALSNQMARLFQSSELRGILSSFMRGNEHLTFRVGKVRGSSSVMETSYGENGNIIITLNKEYVSDRGFYASSIIKDNVGYAHSGADSVFAVGIAHEAMHAKHYHIRDEAVRYSGGDLSKAAEFVRSRYGDALANVMFRRINGRWEHNSDFIKDEHDYLKKNNQGSFNRVLNQYLGNK